MFYAWLLQRQDQKNLICKLFHNVDGRGIGSCSEQIFACIYMLFLQLFISGLGVCYCGPPQRLLNVQISGSIRYFGRIKPKPTLFSLYGELGTSAYFLYKICGTSFLAVCIIPIPLNLLKKLKFLLLAVNAFSNIFYAISVNTLYSTLSQVAR